MRSLHARLTFAVAVLLCLLGGVLIFITERTSEQYADEIRQRLDAGVAMYVVDEMRLMPGGRVDTGALRTLAERAMIINPSAEVYLLDPRGRIIAPPGAFERESIDLAPLKRFLRNPSDRPIYADDPKSHDGARVFSVAPIADSGRLTGYLYVVLGGRPVSSVADRIAGSYTLRVGALSLSAVVVITMIAAAGLFFGLTRRLRSLEKSMAAWSSAGPSKPAPTEPSVAGGDEIDRLSRRFQAMSAAIDAHLDELKATDRMRREFLAGVSHDLRTPLASLRGYIETAHLRAATAKNSDLASYLRIALRQADQLGRLIESLFELARLESGIMEIRREAVSIAELLQDISLKFRLLAEEAGLRLVTSLDTSGVIVDADIELVERAVSNLVENAIRHTPRGGEIRISMTAGRELVIVQVTDTGDGVDADLLPEVFTWPQREWRPRDLGRAGLGLPIAKRIIALHGQDVRITSRKGVGTTVEFALARLNACEDAVLSP